MQALMRSIITEPAVHPIPLSPGQKLLQASLTANDFLLSEGATALSALHCWRRDFIFN